MAKLFGNEYGALRGLGSASPSPLRSLRRIGPGPLGLNARDSRSAVSPTSPPPAATDAAAAAAAARLPRSRLRRPRVRERTGETTDRRPPAPGDAAPLPLRCEGAGDVTRSPESGGDVTPAERAADGVGDVTRAAAGTARDPRGPIPHLSPAPRPDDRGDVTEEGGG